jgi:hypothetical protein
VFGVRTERNPEGFLRRLSPDFSHSPVRYHNPLPHPLPSPLSAVLRFVVELNTVTTAIGRLTAIGLFREQTQR